MKRQHHCKEEVVVVGWVQQNFNFHLQLQVNMYLKSMTTIVPQPCPPKNAFMVDFQWHKADCGRIVNEMHWPGKNPTTPTTNFETDGR